MSSSVKEIWKPIKLKTTSKIKKYVITENGQVASYTNKIDDCLVLKQHSIEGYPAVSIKTGLKNTTVFVHKLLALVFLVKPNNKCTIVLHLDYDRENNALSNLKWATPKDAAAHIKNSPAVILATKRKIPTGTMAKKLDDKKATALKKEIYDPKRKLSFSQLATKYGIANMNLFRIKKGLFWSHIRVEGEPLWPKHKEYLKNIEFHNKKNKKELELKQKKIIKREAQLKVYAKNKKIKDDAKKIKLAIVAKRKTEVAKEKIAVIARRTKRLKLVEIKKLQEAKKNSIKKTVVKKNSTKKAATKKTNFTLVKVFKNKKR